MTMQELFAEAARIDASDIHIIVGFPPMIRVAGKLRAVANTSVLNGTQTEELVLSVMNPQQKEIFMANKETDFSVASPSGRFRVNVYYQKGSVAGAFRLIPNKIRGISELGLPDTIKEFTKLHQGFVLVTGPTGQGKSTSLAAMIQSINESKALHIVTIEDPIEYVYPTGLSIVSQREMHEDSLSWSIALRSVLREDPDVVLIGEMRDFETIQAAITIAETGHLVFATLHTNSAAQTVDRIVDVFPEHQQAQIRLQLSNVLEGIVAQRLIPSLSGGRVPVCEIMTGTPAVKSIIRDGKTHQLDNTILTSAEFSMMTLEMSLANAVRDNKISVEVATQYALRPDDLGRLLKRA